MLSHVPSVNDRSLNPGGSITALASIQHQPSEPVRHGHCAVPLDARSSFGSPMRRQVDLWALGVCMYQWAFGRLPFVGMTVFETFAAITGTQAPDPPAQSAASPALRGVIKQVRRRPVIA